MAYYQQYEDSDHLKVVQYINGILVDGTGTSLDTLPATASALTVSALQQVFSSSMWATALSRSGAV